MELNPEEREQLRRVDMGEISQDEYDQWLLNRAKIEYAIKEARASLEIEGKQLQEGAEDLIRSALNGEIDEKKFIELALELAKGGKKK
ncbi:hypothetical protein ABES02_29075 [Neobacillus pocheonensis]|uniref:hypothetical protein n=1 Tax=Neobacillus pocheonensis TaxID=363869 RepID=UPI003D2BD0F5